MKAADEENLPEHRHHGRIQAQQIRPQPDSRAHILYYAVRFHRRITGVSRSQPSALTEAVSSARRRPESGARLSQRAASTRSIWPWLNSATSPELLTTGRQR